MNDTAMIQVDTSAALMPVLDTGVARARYQAFRQFVSDILVQDVDFGVIPGTDKPTLLKPGAEKFITFFGLAASFETTKEVESWDAEEPFFYYRYKCILRRIKDGAVVGEGEGSANSRESRYRWRWVNEEETPFHLDPAKLVTRSTAVSEFAFAIEKGETTGKYGKPADYWLAWRTAIQDGTAHKVMRKTKNGDKEAWEMTGVQYRIPNPDIESQVNTIQKISQKRALIAAVLVTTNASDYFTQDLEDLDYGSAPYTPARQTPDDVIDGEAEPEQPASGPDSIPGVTKGLPNTDDVTDLLDRPCDSLQGQEVYRVREYSVKHSGTKHEKHWQKRYSKYFGGASISHLKDTTVADFVQIMSTPSSEQNEEAA